MVKVYIEGGGESNSLRTDLRKAFQNFFISAGLNKKPRVVASGSRNEAFDDFCCAVRTLSDNDVALLLVDSEETFTKDDNSVEYLKKRDSWNFPNDVDSCLVHLMVVTMETWLIADPKSLQESFGAGFNSEVFSKVKDIETVSKEDAYSLLDKAFKDTPSKKYIKGKHSFRALACVDASKVCAVCKHANLFINKLKELESYM
ncbi:MAG: DUF4276 family protein [Candidatus Cloacimonetes bacterium]|nr:DUF4276 family protein [Candidatus Cloacimonadota bacterium]